VNWPVQFAYYVVATSETLPLLHDFNRQDWPLWFEAHGVAAPNCKKGSAFSECHLVVRAAVAGQGLALVRDIYAEDDPDEVGFSHCHSNGRFRRIGVLPTGPKEGLRPWQKPAVRRFRDWLIEEARHEISSPTVARTSRVVAPAKSPRMTASYSSLSRY
jgi:DNA-binding transcriptional LysR family regulator